MARHWRKPSSIGPFANWHKHHLGAKKVLEVPCSRELFVEYWSSNTCSKCLPTYKRNSAYSVHMLTLEVRGLWRPSSLMKYQKLQTAYHHLPIPQRPNQQVKDKESEGKTACRKFLPRWKRNILVTLIGFQYLYGLECYLNGFRYQWAPLLRLILPSI